MRTIAAIVSALVLLVAVLVAVLLGNHGICEFPSTGHRGVSSSGFVYPTDRDATTVTSPFGPRVLDGVREFHKGIDIAGPVGTPLYAFADGVVVAAADEGVSGFGGWVVLDHVIDGHKWQTVYGHINPGGVYVQVGDHVSAGDHIADMGNAGRSFGSHLHFEIVDGDRAAGGTQVDPQPWLDKTGDSAPEVDAPDTPTPGKMGFDEAQLDIARQIVAVGEAREESDQAIVIALATAMHESNLRNYANDGSGAYQSAGASGATPDELRRSLEYPHDAVGHDHASVGPFQQQVGFWGTVDELMDPSVQAQKFYDALEQVDYESMSVGEAASAVQRNATGTGVYQSQAPQATQLRDILRGAGDSLSSADLARLGAGKSSSHAQTDCEHDTGGFTGVIGDVAKVILAAARSQFGSEYVWGGGDYDGPSNGGFDCSGLVLYAIAQATNQQVHLCHNTNCQMVDPAFETVSWEDRQPGDILFFGTPGVDYHHTSIYVGDENGVPYQYEAQDFGVPLGKYPVRMGEDIQVRRLKTTVDSQTPSPVLDAVTTKSEG